MAADRDTDFSLTSAAMNDHQKVFNVIKTECEKQKHISQITCFEHIAVHAGIAPDKLPSYLDHLQDIGLIKYSATDRYIYLTTFGRKQRKFEARN